VDEEPLERGGDVAGDRDHPAAGTGADGARGGVGGVRGGRPPKVDEAALRARYGQAGVDLVRLLHRLAREGGFTLTDAARHWADQDAEAAQSSRILRSADPGGDGIDRRRLSETMKMDKGPMPAGLVGAFLELWARRHDDGDRVVPEVAAELTRLCRQVIATHQQAVAPITKPGVTGRAGEAARLKDELLQVQRDLIRIQNSKAGEQLGSDKALVRLAGLYALERLAQDNPVQRQTVVNVFRTGFDGDIEHPEDSTSWRHHGSTRMSCVNGRHGWRSKPGGTRPRPVGRSSGSRTNSVCTRKRCGRG
jgi:plasmid stabilization system protein ParE